MDTLIGYHIAYLTGSAIIAVCAIYMISFARLLQSKGQMLLGFGFLILAISSAISGLYHIENTVVILNVVSLMSFIIIYFGCRYFLYEIHAFKSNKKLDIFILVGGLGVIIFSYINNSISEGFYFRTLPGRLYLFIGYLVLFRKFWLAIVSPLGKVLAITFLLRGIHYLDYYLVRDIDFLSGGGILVSNILIITMSIGLTLHLLKVKTGTTNFFSQDDANQETSPGFNISKDKDVCLTKRQIEILHLLANGSLNKEIAFELEISEPTVSFHLRNMKDKLGARTNREIVSKALSLGLIQHTAT